MPSSVVLNLVVMSYLVLTLLDDGFKG